MAVDLESVRKNIASTWGKDTPILQGNNLQMLLDAGKNLPDPYLPVVLALRETQGGKDNQDPNKNKNLGKNNIFNIRDNNGAFVNYPDLKTAIYGGVNPYYGDVQSKGLVGTLTGDIYKDYNQTKDVKDLFKHWSPPTDSNGNLDEQANNFGWIKNKVAGEMPMATSIPTAAPTTVPTSSPMTVPSKKPMFTESTMSPLQNIGSTLTDWVKQILPHSPLVSPVPQRPENSMKFTDPSGNVSYIK